MPLYEYHCVSCEFTFEILATLSEADKKKPCPECGRRSPRIVSAFAIASGNGNLREQSMATTAAQQARDPRPMCMQYPQIPLSCHMDEPSVRRFAAHATGRGAEFDDKMAQAAEVRKQRGMPDPTYAPPAHGHDHDHHHFRRHGASQNGHSEPQQSHDHIHDHKQTHEKGHGRAPGHSHGKKGKHSRGVHAH